MITVQLHDLVRPLSALCSLYENDDEEGIAPVRLTAAGGKLFFHVGDAGPVSLRAEVPATGEFVTNAEPVVDLLRLRQAAAALHRATLMSLVSLSATEGGFGLVLHCGDTAIRLDGLDSRCRKAAAVNNWPEPGSAVELSSDLLRSLATVWRAADDDTSRTAILNRVRLSAKDGERLVMEALDGHQYRRVSQVAPGWAALLPEQGIQVSRLALEMLRHVLPLLAGEDTLSGAVFKGGQSLCLSGPWLRASVKLSDSAWPETGKFRARAAEGASEIYLGAGRLRLALEVMAAVSDDIGRSVILRKSDNGALHLTAGSGRLGRASTLVKALWSGPCERVSFPVSCLLDWLEDCPYGSDIRIRLASEEAPALFACQGLPDYESIIMPMKVADDGWVEHIEVLA